jgi:hypothetical protein
MGLEHIRNEIENMRLQVRRQRKDILQLQRAGIDIKSAKALLTRMFAKIDGLVVERDALAGNARIKYPGIDEIINGMPASRRAR